jgi:hypothetical protein
MGSEFLSELSLSAEEKRKLAELGASTPAALLSLRRAAPEAFENLLGKERAKEVVEQLWSLLTPDEQARLSTAHPPRRFPLGARLDTPPTGLPPPNFDVEKRDRIFNELQSLRKLSSLSPVQRNRIADLERELNALLECK